MVKVKIEIEIDVDFQKHFDNIPKGLYKDGGGFDDYYVLEAIHDVLRDSYTGQLMNTMDWMAKSQKEGDDNYKWAKHHLDISTEIAEKINKNAKVKIVK